MDFINALKEAKKVGLTKEEFLPIWESESKMKLMREEAQLLASKRKDHQSAHSDNGHNLQAKIEALFSQHKQESQRDGEMLKAALEKKFKELQSHITKQFDNQTKLLLQQALTKDHVHENSKSFQELLMNEMRTMNDSVATQVVEKLKETYNSNKRKERTGNRSNSRASAASQTIPKTSETGDNGYDKPEHRINATQLQREHELSQKYLNTQWELSGTEPLAEEWNLIGQKGKVVKGTHPIPEADSNSSENSAAAAMPNVTVATSVPGTGPHAVAIAEMMAERETVDLSRHNNEAAPNKNSPSVTYIPDSGHCFEICKCDELMAKHRDFFTDYLYTRPKPCRVRLRLWFNRNGRLGVHLLISKGVFDEHHKWPIVLKGDGYIYNFSSRTYTRLWEIPSQECYNSVENTEVTVGASVCLLTSRNEHEDVTYALLDKKGYRSDKNAFFFKWDLKASEKRLSSVGDLDEQEEYWRDTGIRY